MSRLPLTVIILGLVSLLNDVASDMIAPLLPVFLATTLGAGPAAIGLIEGVAETTASMLKLWAGRLGDSGVGHKKLALTGYSFSNTVRPLIGLAGSWPMVLLLRFGDRVGKGIRTAPRDALIALTVDQEIRGRAFGLHRAMDHTGAMLGPLLAAGLLGLGMEMRHVFVASVIPGICAVLLLALFVREPRSRERHNGPLPPLRWSLLPRDLKGLILATGGLSLAAVPDAFLVLWLNQDGIKVHWIPFLWALAHALRAVVSLPAGRLSDRVGRLPVMIGGWLLRVVLLALIPWFDETTQVTALFLAYAAATATTEGAERALIGDVSAPEVRGTAFGLYHMTVALLALPGALWFGTVWQEVNMHTAFLLSAGLSLGATLWLAWRVRRLKRSHVANS